MKHHEDKTNVMRLLEQRNIPYKSHYYKDSGLISGVDVINYLHENPNSAYKTLVTRSKTDENYVFLVPVSKELDLKLAAEAVGEKKIKMVKSIILKTKTQTQIIVTRKRKYILIHKRMNCKIKN